MLFSHFLLVMQYSVYRLCSFNIRNVSLFTDGGHMKSNKLRVVSVLTIANSTMLPNFHVHYKLLLPKRDQKFDSKIM